MSRFIPYQYDVQTPEEQARLKGKFFKFINYVSVDSHKDCQLTISEQDGKIHLYVPTDQYVIRGAVSISITGNDGTTADITSFHRIARIQHKSSVEVRQDLEVIIGDDTFVLEGFNRTYL